MSNGSYKEGWKHIRNFDQWQPSGGINPCSQPHNSPLRPCAHGPEIEYCLWDIMEIEENELDKEWWGRQAVNI